MVGVTEVRFRVRVRVRVRFRVRFRHRVRHTSVRRHELALTLTPI